MQKHIVVILLLTILSAQLCVLSAKLIKDESPIDLDYFYKLMLYGFSAWSGMQESCFIYSSVLKSIGAFVIFIAFILLVKANAFWSIAYITPFGQAYGLMNIDPTITTNEIIMVPLPVALCIQSMIFTDAFVMMCRFLVVNNIDDEMKVARGLWVLVRVVNYAALTFQFSKYPVSSLGHVLLGMFCVLQAIVATPDVGNFVSEKPNENNNQNQQ